MEGNVEFGIHSVDSLAFSPSAQQEARSELRKNYRHEDAGALSGSHETNSEALDCVSVHFDENSHVRTLPPQYVEDATSLLSEIPPFLQRTYKFGNDMESLMELVTEEKQKFQVDQANLGGTAVALQVERGEWRDSLRKLHAEFCDIAVELRRLRTYRASLEKVVADQTALIETLTRAM